MNTTRIPKVGQRYVFRDNPSNGCIITKVGDGWFDMKWDGGNVKGSWHISEIDKWYDVLKLDKIDDFNELLDKYYGESIS